MEVHVYLRIIYIYGIEDLLNKFGYLIGSELLESLIRFKKDTGFFFSDMAVAAEGLRLR